MKKIFTLVLSVLFATAIFAQSKPVGIIMKASVAPEIDGQIDDVWGEANTYSIDKNFQQELPTLGETGQTTWKALYDKDWFYLLLEVTDDVHLPAYLSSVGGADYNYDKTEVYFDVNYNLEDGVGCAGSFNKGHYQYSVPMVAGNVDGTQTTQAASGMVYTFNTSDAPNYIAEYKIPLSFMVDKDGGPMDLTADIGFDVTIIDRDIEDESRKRSVWANIGGVAESWANMDDCGIINFDGAEAPVFIDEITVSADGNITQDNQTLQVVAEVLPEDATSKTVKWVIEKVGGGVARATISSDGVITPLVDEEVLVIAKSPDDFVESEAIQISITGQKVTMDEINYIKNGNFDLVNANTGGPLKWQGFDAGTAVITDGVLNIAPAEVKTNIWDYKLFQIINVPYGLKDLDYILTFKAWADEERSFQLKIEDQNNGWTTYGESSDPNSDGKTFWPAANMKITTEPTTYTLNMNFKNMVENCKQHFNWQIGESTAKIHLDSIYLVSVADLGLISTSIYEVAEKATFDVYPNPVNAKLNIRLTSINTLVSIYNSLGIKVEETVVYGTEHTFDVDKYSPGLYFVRANNQVVKFVK